MRNVSIDSWRSTPVRAEIARLPAWQADWRAANGAPSELHDAPGAGTGTGDAQQLRIDITPVEQILRKTQSVALGRYRCPIDHPQFMIGGGPHTCSYIAFHRTSVKMKIGDWRAEVATPNNVSFYNIGESYSREAIGGEGDECDWLALSPTLLRSARLSRVWPALLCCLRSSRTSLSRRSWPATRCCCGCRRIAGQNLYY